MSGKLNKKVTARIFFLVVSVSFAVTIIVYLMHDVRLDVEIRKLAITDVPDIRLENIKFERDMFGALWKINIPNLERQSGIVKILSIDVSREMPSGDIWEVSGKRGEYVESSEKATFNKISGRIIVDSQIYYLHAPSVSWEKSGDLVILPEGFAIKGEFNSISADKAKVEAGNLITIEKGGEIIWNISSYDIKN